VPQPQREPAVCAAPCKDSEPCHEEKTAQAFLAAGLAERLAAMGASVTRNPCPAAPARDKQRRIQPTPSCPALSPHQRVAHALATIRTLIRSLLRRPDLPAVVRHRLEQIDSECSEQIDRFALIFHAPNCSAAPAPASPWRRNRFFSIFRFFFLFFSFFGDPAWQKAAAAVGAAAGRRGLVLKLEIEDSSFRS